MHSSDTYIRLAREEDFSNILQFELDVFIQSEPTCLALGITKDAATDFFTKEVKNCLKYPINFVALSDDGTIAGIILCSLKHSSPTSCAPMQNISQRNQIVSEEAMKIIIPKHKEPMEIFLHYIGSLEGRYENTIPACKGSIIHIETICVNIVRFGCCGIGRNLLQTCFDNARQLGIEGASASAISHASQNLFNKIGFRAVRSIKHSNVVDEDGRRIINCREKTKEGQLVFKVL